MSVESDSRFPHFVRVLEFLLPWQLVRECDLTRFHVLVAGAVIVVILTITFKRIQRYRLGYKTLPGPWSWPLLGHVRKLSQRPHVDLTQWHRRYGDVYQVKIGQADVVVVGSWDAILEGLTDKTMCHRPDMGHFNVMYDTEQGRQRGLCTSDPGEKSHVRKSFLSSSLDAYCSDSNHIQDKLSSEVIDTVNRLLDCPSPCDPLTIFKPACLNVIFRLAFSQRFDPQGPLMKETLSTLDNRGSLLQLDPVDFCPMMKIFHTDDMANFVQNRTEIQRDLQHKFINFHKDTYDRQHIRNMTDHLLMSLENGDDFGLLDRDDMDYLLLDVVNFGYQAIAVTLTWLLGFVASDLDLQKQVQKELDRVVGRNRLPGLEDQPFLPLTTAVIFETLRLASTHPFLLPHAASEDTVLKGYHIPKGTIILFNVWSLNHDPKLWENPHAFQPKRFLNKDNNLEIPDHFLPYGAGHRQCPGESLAEVSLFLFLSTILHQTSVQPEGKDFKMVPEGSSLLLPKTFHIRVTERDGEIA